MYYNFAAGSFLSKIFEGVGHFDHPLKVKGTSPTNHCWVAVN